MIDTLAPEFLADAAEVAEVEDTSFLVHTHKLHLFHDKIDKANRRLARNDIAGRFEAVRIGEKTVENNNGTVERWLRFELNRPELNVLEGWKFVATVKFEEGGTLLQIVPGETLHGVVDRAALDSHWCDHCGTRRQRTRSYLVRNTETGEIKQIGSNCLELFFGVEIKGLWALEWTADEFGEAEESEGFGGGGYSQHTYGVRFVLALTHVLTNGGRGFVSRGAARDDETKAATADEVLHHIHFVPRPSQDWRNIAETARVRENMEAAHTLLNDQPEVIDAILAAAETLREGDYKDNMMVAVRSEHITGAALGVLVSLIMVFHRNAEQAANAAKEAKGDDRLNEYVGAVKERLRDMVLTVKMAKEIETAYGMSTLLVMEDAQGRTFKWFASGYQDLDAGDTVKITGTVKGHEEYQGRKQTMITRCKWEKI